MAVDRCPTELRSERLFDHRRPTTGLNTEVGSMTATEPLASIDWDAWYDRWERQQEAYVAHREPRFDAMLDMLESLPADFVAIDLACGPGSIARRIVARFPRATVIAVDIDPVMLAMARAAVPEASGRLTVREDNLGDPTWADRIGVTKVDAVLSTTAIHWLSTAEIVELYRTLARLIRPGGVFMNGDHLGYGESQPQFAAAAKRVRDEHSVRAFAAGVEDSDQWWDALRAEPGSAALLAARERAFAARTRPGDPSFALHEAALLDAGFVDVDTIWQHFENRVLAAFR
jgi:SAM-dependent methyltransferase